jgi:phosphatidylinositol-3-phosphatase
MQWWRIQKETTLRRSIVLLAAAATLATLGTTAYQGSASASFERAAAVKAATTTAVPSFGHVFVFVGENKDITQVTSTSPVRDPFIQNTLKPESAWFTGYNSITTGSLADYIALTSGQFAECQRQGPCGKFDTSNIFAELTAAHQSWRDWNESMPNNCYPGKTGSMTTWNYYKNGHNPSLWYKNLNSGTSPTLCQQWDVPTGLASAPNDMTTFNADVAAGTVPTYNFISPNGCEAGYQTCYTYDDLAPAGHKVNALTEYDHFLSKEIPAIQNSRTCSSNNCLFVATFDEGGHTRGTPTMLAVTGQGVVPGTYNGYYDHYSTLKTIEDGLGVPCTNNACGNDYLDFNGVTRQATDLPIFGG